VTVTSCLEPSTLQEVSAYRFSKEDLRLNERRPGISAFMRIKNGADFLELTIRSHIEFFDEIVAVYNQCTDNTAEVLAKLQSEYGPEKLKVIHYLDRVFPPGSDDHARTPPDSPNSLVNYYNFALAATQYTYATKLDDDHLAMPGSLRGVVDLIRSSEADNLPMLCFSGLNLFPSPSGPTSICKRDPISGGGDIGFFRLTNQTYFTHDRRFEKFHRGSMPRHFAGYLYWHLKYLKPELGFSNYELDRYQSSRYAIRKQRLESDSNIRLELAELIQSRRPDRLSGLRSLFSEKQALIGKRDEALGRAFPYATCDEAVRATVDPAMYNLLLPRIARETHREPPV
jgi:hypothetical protein